MRGAPSGKVEKLVECGIIPAYAGSTSRPDESWRAFGDHPRVCGEHVVPVLPARLGEGSSPRMRGAHRVCSVCVLREGIIPAYAGSTVAYCMASMPPQDHPRVCGEHAVEHSASLGVVGSSPRMRGARAGHSPRAVVNGIIPAYAGSTSPARPCDPAGGDHPRVCGEHLGERVHHQPAIGSSPRMRGAHHGPRDVQQGLGIIPAYAGSTSAAQLCRLLARDHPRVCGEHRSSAALRSCLEGSSPRMRGAQLMADLLGRLLGIIPAYAGSTNF